MATEDARYRETSQYRLWSFSPSKLAAMRETTNAAARASISERLLANPPPPSAAAAISAPTSSANTPDPENGGNSTPNPNALPEFLTPADELHLVSFYTSELLRAATEVFNFPDHIKTTAAIFFKRFYVTNSIMTYPPTEMMIVALFFGCKAEGMFMDVREFVQRFGKKNNEEILAGEFLLCQGLRFSLDVKHPFRALRGAIMKLASFDDIDRKRLDDAEQRAREILRFAPIMTDAYFHYTPSQIMMAALSLADRGLAERLIQDTFHFVAPPETGSGADTPDPNAPVPAAPSAAKQKPGEDKAAIIGSHLRDKVLGAIEACRDILSKELPERRDHWTNKSFIKTQISPLRKKLTKCRDPDRWNLVELQRARREQAIKKGGSEDGDPEDRGLADGAVFGEPLGQPLKKRKVEVKKEEDPFGGAL
ncbi:cyclin-like protein [Podospora australis]|uniref:Cyclin-like protein n=1 Tax=Podospora australis TaxID=1536484 RepID=A0AAN6WNU1_9PEZI|nr:cyclin-like protein [Podospora australis]